MSIKTKWGVLSTLIYQMELHEYLMDFKEYINTHLDLDRVPIILDNVIIRYHYSIAIYMFFKPRFNLISMLNLEFTIIIIEDFKMICRG